MKKILSIVLTIVLAVSCLSIFTNAASDPVVIYESDPITNGPITTEYTVEVVWNDDNTMTLTVYSDALVVGSDIPNLSFCAYINYYKKDLKYVDGSQVVVGHDNDGCLQNYQLVEIDDELEGASGGHSMGTYTEGEVYRSSVSWTFEVLAAPGSEIVLWEDGFETATGIYCCYNGNEWYNGGDVMATITVPEAAEEDTHTAPATPVADTKDACEACGTAAGVRFLMTVDKTAADYADVTAYGVVIETADGEYKYTVDANTKKAETDTKIEYAVVVTGAPAGTTFTATAFLVYSDNCEVAGVSGELTA